MPNLRTLVTITLTLLALGGCTGGERESWKFSLAPVSGKAGIDMDGVAVVFESIPFDQARGGASGSLIVAGYGTHRMKVTAAGLVFENAFEGGVNTMQFEGHTLTLQDGGTLLRIGDQEFDLSGDKPTIVIDASGVARIATE